MEVGTFLWYITSSQWLLLNHLKEASLKHLSLKTVFLLVVGSGKRSEIHAVQLKNIKHQTIWSKVSLYSSPSFLSKNQLAKESPDSVAPVVIPSLPPDLDKSLKAYRSLCLVRACATVWTRLQTSDRTKNWFLSLSRKALTKTFILSLSQPVARTVILLYELFDHKTLTQHQIKAHDVRAFAASKAFRLGVSLEQLISASH